MSVEIVQLLIAVSDIQSVPFPHGYIYAVSHATEHCFVNS